MNLVDRFERALIEAGFNVLDAEKHPKAEDSGFISIGTEIVIGGEAFDGEVMIVVDDGDVEVNGADIWEKHANVEEGGDREVLLNQLSASRDEDSSGAIWTYHSRNNIDDNLVEIETQV